MVFAINNLVSVLDHAYPVVRDADTIFDLKERMPETCDRRPPDGPRVTGRAAVQIMDRAFMHGIAAPFDLVQDVSGAF